VSKPSLLATAKPQLLVSRNAGEVGVAELAMLGILGKGEMVVGFW